MLNKNFKGMFSKMGEGLLEKYVKDLEEELKSNPDDPELLFKLGVAYLRIGRVTNAREVYKKLRELDSQRAKELLDMIYEV